MLAKAKQYVQLMQNMGLRYVGFRLLHAAKVKAGWLKKKFPINPAYQQYFTLENWQKQRPAFFLDIPVAEQYDKLGITPLQQPACLLGKYTFFNSVEFDIPFDDWLTHPETGHVYSHQQHWSAINDFSATAGDIKYIWERSRFSFLYAVIRYDEQQGTNHSQWVFDAILSWIAANPINAGPNYKCSQEISLRLLNWTFALHYYQHSSALTPAVFNKMQHAIYWQAKHVFDNIHFSRIAVRNNHAITETLTLYIIGSLFPQFPNAAQWKAKGKQWFEKEVAYQVYEDGTFLQFSMNYHRVVVQLFSWAIAVANALQEKWSDTVYDRAYKSVKFLATCQDSTTGWLPNYGSNDGALFFPLNNAAYRNYRPALQALHLQLTGKPLYPQGWEDEDAWWFRAATPHKKIMLPIQVPLGWHQFAIGGYAILREQDTLTFIRCGNHQDRPAQADNLHLDIWHKGVNLLQDSGTYKYNTTAELTAYFMGTLGHNTVMLGSFDQMQKGSRFIWFHWTQALQMELTETNDAYIFNGSVKAFGQVGDNIVHHRGIKKMKFADSWEVVDVIENKPAQLPIRQYWHPAKGTILLHAKDGESKALTLQTKAGWVSSCYGEKTENEINYFETLNNRMETVIDV